MRLHLVDGTWELFRAHYAKRPGHLDPKGRERKAAVGVVYSMLRLLEQDEKEKPTHIAIAFDNPIESFRNELFPGYKTSAGIDPDLFAQFPLVEAGVEALGVVVWPMVEFEADDALAAATAKFKNEGGVDQIVICSPDKDLTQLVAGSRIVCWDRRREIVLDEPGVVGKFGVRPESIPDWLALVGDAADGYPGIPGWGAKSASAVLSRYPHLEVIPDDPKQFGLSAGRAARLAESLAAHRQEALLYRKLATLREDVPLGEKVADLEWQGARSRLKDLCREWGEAELPKRISRWR